MPKMVSMPEGTPLAAEDLIPKEKTKDKADASYSRGTF